MILTCDWLWLCILYELVWVGQFGRKAMAAGSSVGRLSFNANHWATSTALEWSLLLSYTQKLGRKIQRITASAWGHLSSIRALCSSVAQQAQHTAVIKAAQQHRSQYGCKGSVGDCRCISGSAMIGQPYYSKTLKGFCGSQACEASTMVFARKSMEHWAWSACARSDLTMSCCSVAVQRCPENPEFIFLQALLLDHASCHPQHFSTCQKGHLATDDSQSTIQVPKTSESTRMTFTCQQSNSARKRWSSFISFRIQI